MRNVQAFPEQPLFLRLLPKFRFLQLSYELFFLKSSCHNCRLDLKRYLNPPLEQLSHDLIFYIEYIFNIISHKMRFWLNQIDGSCSQIVVSSDSTFESLIEEYNLSSARLICQGSQIDSTNFLELLCEDINVYVTGDLDGGKKKKKKKVYTTKKKNKHIHKRVKLSIYTLYGVDGKGNVTQQRKTCPSCGPGTFMAQHWDRYYCGFCHTTIKMDAETIKKNEQIMKKKKAALEAEKKAKEKEAADKAPAGKGKKDAKKGAAGKKK